MSLAGFDFQALNRKYLAQPANDATAYGASIIAAPSGDAWRCIGIYHLRPEENNRRHNVYLEVLDENGKRTKQPQIVWTWWIDAPIQVRNLDKPDNEPAADIPIDQAATVTLRVSGLGLASDSVGNLHARHNDEGTQNTWHHHSFYVVYQRQRGGVVVPPIDPPTPPDPPTEPDNDRLTAIETELSRLSLNFDTLWGLYDALKKRLDIMEGD